MYLDKIIQQRLDEKLEALAELRPVQTSLLKKLKHQIALEMTYNSNAIEGNTLDLKETFLVISEGITIKGKSMKEHLEAKDHYEAIEYLNELVSEETKNSFTDVTLRSLHQLIMRETYSEEAGKYRTGNVIITGSDHKPPGADDVRIKMKELFVWIKKNRKKIHIIELSAMIHHKISHIHPFADGNGRLARLIMNLLLMQEGFPLVVILNVDRKKYYNALSKADKGDYIPFVRFIAQATERSLNIYLKTLSSKRSVSDKYFQLSEISKKTPYSVKYLNWLSRHGKIEAHKEGRNWVTSINAVKKYIAERERAR